MTPGWLADLRGAVRGLLRSRAWGGLALLCLALGVGSGAAMLGLLDTLLLRPPAQVREADEIRRLYFRLMIPGMDEVTGPESSYPYLLDLREVRAFAGVEAYFRTDAALGRGAEARRVRAALVTPGFLPLLGVRPALGRSFTGTEGLPGQTSRVALVSHALWQRELGASPGIVGRDLIFGNEVYEVIGALPPGFTGVDLEPVDLWLPMDAATTFMSPRWATSRGSKFLEIVGRLAPSATPEAAAAETTTVFRAAAEAANRPQPTAQVLLGPLQRARGPEASAAVKVTTRLAAVAWVVLLLACIDVTHLFLVRDLGRRHELALRSALGAGRWALARLVLLESLLLAVAGGICALAVTWSMTSVLQRLLLPGAIDLPSLDLRRVAMVAGVALLAAIVAGAIPAIRASSSATPLGDLRVHTGLQPPGSTRWLSGLAVVQVALTLALLLGAAWFVRSLSNALHLDLGLDADQVLVATADFEGSGATPGEAGAALTRAAEQLTGLPGIVQTAVAATIPFELSQGGKLAVPGRETLPSLPTGGPYINAVSEGFFTTLGTALLRGRPFDRSDQGASARVVIVNQTLARLLWPDEDPVGECLQVGGAEAPCSAVVGVVEDARRAGIEEAATAQFYVPLSQAPEELASRALFVRVERDPDASVAAVGRAVQQAAPGLLASVRSLRDLLAPQLHPWKMGAEALTLFGMVALLLSIAGLYGVVAHTLTRRTRELGIRAALGASPSSLSGLVVRQGLGIALAGAGCGLLLAAVLARQVEPLLFRVSPWNPWLAGAVTALLLGVALAASYLPSGRIRSMDLTRVIREAA